MKSEKESNQRNVSTIWQNPLVKKISIGGIALLVAFLLGFVPMWLKARGAASELAQAQVLQKRLTLERAIAAAAINARRGEYEPARQQASDFFTALREEAEKDQNSAFTAAQKESFNQLFARRDETITLLARNDPAAADRLADVYFMFRQAVNGISTPAVSNK